MLLAVALDEERGRLPAEPPGDGGRDGAGIDGVEVAPRRQHVGPAAGRGAGRAGLEEAPVEGGQHPPELRLRTRLDRGPDPLVDLPQHGPGSRPRRRTRTDPADERTGERLEPFDGVAGGPPRTCRTVERVRERGGTRPAPPRSEVAVQGVESFEPEVAGERPGDRGARPRILAARDTDEGDEEVEKPVRVRTASEHVQAVPDLHFLELAEIRVELREGGAGLLPGGDAAVPVEPEARDQLEDLVPEEREPPRIHPGRLVVLVDEAFEVGERTVALGPGERGGEVVDDHRLGAALRLGPLARVVDDEGIDVRQGSERRLREALLGEGEGLSRQPLEVSVLAHVHDGVHPGPQPRVEREVAVRGNEVRVVVGGGGVDVVATRRLEPDRNVAEPNRRHRERRPGLAPPASSGAVPSTRKNGSAPGSPQRATTASRTAAGRVAKNAR